MLAQFEDADIETVLAHITKTNPGTKAQLPVGELQILERVPLLNHDGGRYGKGEVITEMDIHPDLWFFKCHFPGDPVMPGCLGIEGLWQTLGMYLSLRGYKGKGRALGVGNLKFFGEVLPDSKKLQFHLHIERIVARKWAVVVADGEVIVDGKTIYEAEQVKVGIFPESMVGFPA